MVSLAIVLLAGLVLRLPTFARPLLSDDEAIYAATADAMRQGALLYRDAVDHKPPLIYFIYRAGFALTGPFETLGAHLAVVLAVLMTGLGLFVLGRRGAGGDREGVVAAGLFLVFSTTWHDYDALAANCELFLLVFWVAAAALFVRPGWWAQLAVGALVGLAVLCKYQGATFLAASVGVLVVQAFRREIGWGRVVAGVLAQSLGLALPIGLYLAYAAAAGSLEASLAWFRFNFLYVGAGLSGLEAVQRGLRRLALIGAMALPVYLAGGVEVVAALRRARREPLELRTWMLLLWLAGAIVALAAGGRFFGHYFHLVLPPLALLAAPRVLALWSRMPFRIALVVATAIPALLFFAFATFLRPVAEAIDHRDPPYQPVADQIAALSTPDERMFVWGNSPQLYVLARRSMGTRFSFCNYMTGESPGTRTETGALDPDRNQHAPAWEMLFADLEARRPALFVDAAAAGWDGYEKFPLARYPRLAAYIAAHYQPVRGRSEMERVVIYRRRAPAPPAPP